MQEVKQEAMHYRYHRDQQLALEKTSEGEKANTKNNNQAMASKHEKQEAGASNWAGVEYTDSDSSDDEKPKNPSTAYWWNERHGNKRKRDQRSPDTPY